MITINDRELMMVDTSIALNKIPYIKPDDLADRIENDFVEKPKDDTCWSEPLECSSKRSEKLEVIKSEEVHERHKDKKCIIIDLRSMFQYQKSHIRHSINLTNCALMSKRIQDGKLQVKQYLEPRVALDSSKDIVIYEETGYGTDFADLICNNLKSLSPEVQIFLLEGGYESFFSSHQNLCTEAVPVISRFNYIPDNDDETTFLNKTATEIRPNLYLGGLHDARNDELLGNLGITHILNCCKTPSREDEGCHSYEILSLECDDDLQQSIDQKLQPAFDFIEKAWEASENNKVLIHCYAGVSRSATILIAFLMYSTKKTYDECYKEVKSKRSIIDPNINFVAQLLKYEETLQSDSLKSATISLPRPALQSSTPTGCSEKKKMANFSSKRRQFALPALKIAAPKRDCYSDAPSAPILSANCNPFAKAFKAHNAKFHPDPELPPTSESLDESCE